MWFCTSCMPNIRETIKIEKDIEKRRNEHYESLKRFVTIWKTKLTQNALSNNSHFCSAQPQYRTPSQGYVHIQYHRPSRCDRAKKPEATQNKRYGRTT